LANEEAANDKTITTTTQLIPTTQCHSEVVTVEVAADLVEALRLGEELEEVSSIERRTLRLELMRGKDAEDINPILTAHQQLRRVCYNHKLYIIRIMLIISELGVFQHAVEGEMLCESKNIKIPYFNAPIYLENKVPTTSTLPYTPSNTHRHKSAKSTKSSDL
jgi:hypothetical protein